MISGARRKAVLLLLLVFLAGGAAGVLLEDVVEDFDWPTFGAGRTAEGEAHGGDPLDDDTEEHFLEGLGLSRPQRDSVDRLLDRREDRLEAYWAARLPDMERLIDSTRAEIRALLRPDQRDAYDRWIARQRTPTRIHLEGDR